VSRPRSTNPPQPKPAREPLLDAVGVSGSQRGQVLGPRSAADGVDLELTFGSSRAAAPAVVPRRSTTFTA
jgi:hypothetical protein